MERSIILLLYGAIGLMLSHTISTFYTAIFAVAYILFYVKKLKEKGILEKLCINILFILLITAFFWLPMLEAKTAANYAIFDNYRQDLGGFILSNFSSMENSMKYNNILDNAKKIPNASANFTKALTEFKD